MRLLTAHGCMVVMLLLVCSSLLTLALPNKNRYNTVKSSSKKAEAPRHSLGTGARTGLIGAGVLGGVLSSGK
ncbi:uncharacterized protein LOC128729139 [Anopheles nili]|uniref:uncharacterized protein LOC128729139 n=1 Tax=Anopheles nili TaxID=185578 RepID=UPI00237B49AD|nr:uncharacterized protein LOC128729139 [Anopheles nili]